MYDLDDEQEVRTELMRTRRYVTHRLEYISETVDWLQAHLDRLPLRLMPDLAALTAEADRLLFGAADAVRAEEEEED